MSFVALESILEVSHRHPAFGSGGPIVDMPALVAARLLAKVLPDKLPLMAMRQP